MKTIVQSVLASIPWLSAMYLLFLIEKNGVWTIDTPFRDVMSIAIVATGMVISFLLQSKVLDSKP